MKKLIILLSIIFLSLVSMANDTTFVAVVKVGLLGRSNYISIDNGSGELIKERRFVSSAKFIQYVQKNYKIVSINTVSASVIPYLVVIYTTKS